MGLTSACGQPSSIIINFRRSLDPSLLKINILVIQTLHRRRAKTASNPVNIAIQKSTLLLPHRGTTASRNCSKSPKPSEKSVFLIRTETSSFGLSRPWFTEPFTPVILLQTKVGNRKVRTKQGRRESALNLILLGKTLNQ